jgi:protein kinase C substrate 80K-H
LRSKTSRLQSELDTLHGILEELSKGYNPNYQDMAVKAAVVGYEELTKPFDEESEVKVEESTEVTEEEEEIQDKELDELDKKDLEGLLMMDVDGEVETTEDEGDVGLCKLPSWDIANDSIPDRRIYPRFTL